MIKFLSHISIRFLISPSFWDKEIILLWRILIDSSCSVERQQIRMHSEFVCFLCLCLDRPLLGLPHYQQILLYWADLEKQFHQFFFSGVTELKLTDLTSLRLRNDESVSAFIQRFRDVKNRCYSLVLSDQQLDDAAFQGLLPHIKEKYASQRV